MTKRIFRAICFVALGVAAACIALFLCVLYGYFSDMQEKQLKVQTDLAAQAVASDGLDYFDGLDTAEYRITWIGADGAVLYDNKSDLYGMENHLEREEVKDALTNGSGESFRYSVTLMERALYSAKRLPDGSVIRLSVSQHTLLTLLLGMMQPICGIIVIALGLSLVLAMRLSRQIVNPLNEINLDKPLKNDGYDELSPLLCRIDSQQKQIRMQGEKLLQKQKEFETVTENMTEGIILLNEKGIVLSINPAAASLFESDRSCIGRHILSVSRSSEVSDLFLKAEKGRRAEKTITLAGGQYQLIMSPVISGRSSSDEAVDGNELSGRLSSGEVLSEDASSVRLSSSEALSGAVLLAINVTEKEDAEQMRREFTANVSHELKTPLQTIAGSAELLENGMVKEEDQADFYARIYSEAKRMIRLVEDIIRLSRLDEGAEERKREDVDLYMLAEEVVNRLSAEAEKAKIATVLDGEPAVINGVPQLLQSIIYNLCDNAMKYNRECGSVVITVKNQADFAILSVADTGIGIPQEHQARIFERFYRVDKSRSKELGGTGLGLSIVKHAARLHGAEIDLHSVPGKGTTVTVSFSKKFHR
ncbi:MAG: PAS domain-containing sensor histidine kinase [Eubacterium sp.]|nr:PAS domain-containing sensor histidine kinase [Eubacterium sp.]